MKPEATGVAGGSPEALREAVTAALLQRAGDSGRPAVDRLTPLLYDALRRIAHGQLGVEREGHTLSTTALVHEAYLRLVDQRRVQWTDRAHFLAVAAQMMRRILVDYARGFRAEKRGAKLERIDLDVTEVPLEQRSETLLALDDALARLAELNPRLSRVVECRFFGGMTEEEIAAELGVTERTVRRDWIKAKAWLYREMA